MRMRAEKMTLLGRNASAFTVGDALVGRERGFFAFERQLGRLFAGDSPREEQVEFRLLFDDVVFVRQSAHRVFGSKAGDVVSRLHRPRDSRFGEVGRARIAAPVPDVDRDAERLVAVALDVFELALAHRDAQAAAFGRLGTGVGRAELFGMRQSCVDQVFKERAGVGEAGVGARGRLQAGCLHVLAMILLPPVSDGAVKDLTHVPQTQKRLLRPWRVRC
jgi:hypothetical protein